MSGIKEIPLTSVPVSNCPPAEGSGTLTLASEELHAVNPKTRQGTIRQQIISKTNL